jgi:GNAT superfamily N-acetyltransferase
MSDTLDITIRPYEESDESAVIDLLNAALQGGPAGMQTVEFFRWKHLENPFGQSLLLLAETDGRLVGLRAFMRWELRSGDRTLRAVRAVDTATHPDAQGRGVFSQLTKRALTELEGTDFVFNTPNEKSLPGYLKMGWQRVGKVPIQVRVRRPIRFARGFRSGASMEVSTLPPAQAGSVGETLSSIHGLDQLLASTEPTAPHLRTPSDVNYLRWRYASAPGLDYRIVVHESDGQLEGLAIFRIRSRRELIESAVAELIVAPGAVGAARHLLHDVINAARVDHVTCSMMNRDDLRKATARLGFIPSPTRPTLVVKPLRDKLDPDPTHLGSWGVGLGDLEVF